MGKFEGHRNSKCTARFKFGDNSQIVAHWQDVDTISVFSGVSSGSKSTVGKVRFSPTTTYDFSDCNHNKAAAATCSPARAEPGQPRKFQWESNLLLKPARLAV